MCPAKGLHLLVGTPTKLKRDVDAALLVLRTIGSMQRDSGSGCVANDRASAGLKLFHFIDVSSVHCHAFWCSLLVLNMSSAQVTDKATRPAGEFGNILLSEVIDQLIKQVLGKL